MNDKFLLSQKPLSDKMRGYLHDYMDLGGRTLSGTVADNEICIAKGQGSELITYKIL